MKKEVKIKNLVIIGANSTAVALVKKLLLLDVKLEIIILNEGLLYGDYMINFFKIYNKKSNFKFETTSKKELLNEGVSKIYENIKITKIIADERIIQFQEDRNQTKLKYDYLLYADVPFRYKLDKKLLYNDSPNILNLSDKHNIAEYRNPFFHDFESCIIIGTGYSGIALAINLAKLGKKVTIVIQGKHIYRNVWSDKIEKAMIHDLQIQGIKILLDPINHEYKYEKNSNVITSMAFKMPKKIIEKIACDVVFFSSGEITTNLSLFNNIAEFDYTHHAEFGVKRLKTDNLKIKNRNIYAIGIGTTSTATKNNFADNIVWSDFLKMLHYRSKYEIYQFLKIVADGKLGLSTKIKNPLLSVNIDEYFFDGRQLKFLQLGKSFNYAKKNNKFEYGVIEIFSDNEKLNNVNISLSVLINLKNNTIEGLNLMLASESEKSIKKVFDDYYLFATEFKHIINNKISIDNLLLNEFNLYTSNTKSGLLWNTLYDKLTSLRL